MLAQACIVSLSRRPAPPYPGFLVGQNTPPPIFSKCCVTLKDGGGGEGGRDSGTIHGCASTKYELAASGTILGCANA